MDNKIKILEDGILKEYDVIGLCKNKELNKIMLYIVMELIIMLQDIFFKMAN